MSQTKAERVAKLNGIEWKAIHLTNGKVAMVNPEDYDVLSKHRWISAKDGNMFYAHRSIRVDGKKITIRMHREILGLKDKDGLMVDHINRNGLDNRKKNLRISNKSQNTINTTIRKDNSSGYRGVSYHKKDNKWCANISINGKKKYLGEFGTKEMAAMVYDKNARQLFGDDCYLNLTDAKSILEVIMKREDWLNFAGSIGGYNPSRSVKIDLYYILNPDKLLDEAVKWCEANQPSRSHEKATKMLARRFSK